MAYSYLLTEAASSLLKEDGGKLIFEPERGFLLTEAGQHLVLEGGATDNWFILENGAKLEFFPLLNYCGVEASLYGKPEGTARTRSETKFEVEGFWPCTGNRRRRNVWRER